MRRSMETEIVLRGFRNWITSCLPPSPILVMRTKILEYSYFILWYRGTGWMSHCQIIYFYLCYILKPLMLEGMQMTDITISCHFCGRTQLVVVPNINLLEFVSWWNILEKLGVGFSAHSEAAVSGHVSGPLVFPSAPLRIDDTLHMVLLGLGWTSAISKMWVLMLFESNSMLSVSWVCPCTRWPWMSPADQTDNAQLCMFKSLFLKFYRGPPLRPWLVTVTHS